MKENIYDIKKGIEIGKHDSHKYIFYPCLDCGRKHWVSYKVKTQKPANFRCRVCAGILRGGKNHRWWKGGKVMDSHGYIKVKLLRNNPFYPMATHQFSYIFEHRLIMAQHLDRCLFPWEVVHHKNGIKTDNRLENLELLPDKTVHLVDSLVKSYINRLEKRIILLEAEIFLLQTQLREGVSEVANPKYI